MIIARYYRTDLVTGAADIYVDFAVIWAFDLYELHEKAVASAKRFPHAAAYQLWEGPDFRSLTPIGLKHALI